MTISTIRCYEDADKARVQAAAESFCKRHGISFDQSYDYCDAEESIGYALTDRFDRAELRKLWTACYCRALRVPTSVRITTGYGYIGYHRN